MRARRGPQPGRRADFAPAPPFRSPRTRGRHLPGPAPAPNPASDWQCASGRGRRSSEDDSAIGEKQLRMANRPGRRGAECRLLPPGVVRPVELVEVRGGEPRVIVPSPAPAHARTDRRDALGRPPGRPRSRAPNPPPRPRRTLCSVTPRRRRTGPAPPAPARRLSGPALRRRAPRSALGPSQGPPPPRPCGGPLENPAPRSWPPRLASAPAPVGAPATLLPRGPSLWGRRPRPTPLSRRGGRGGTSSWGGQPRPNRGARNATDGVKEKTISTAHQMRNRRSKTAKPVPPSGVGGGRGAKRNLYLQRKKKNRGLRQERDLENVETRRPTSATPLRPPIPLCSPASP